jgi:hypothetical protein
MNSKGWPSEFSHSRIFVRRGRASVSIGIIDENNEPKIAVIKGTREIRVILYAKDDPFCAPAPADAEHLWNLPQLLAAGLMETIDGFTAVISKGLLVPVP